MSVVLHVENPGITSIKGCILFPVPVPWNFVSTVFIVDCLVVVRVDILPTQVLEDGSFVPCDHMVVMLLICIRKKSLYFQEDCV